MFHADAHSMLTIVQEAARALEHGLHMRLLQRQYFSSRTRDALIDSKAAERQFDREALTALRHCQGLLRVEGWNEDDTTGEDS